jgi:hypothetical protein
MNTVGYRNPDADQPRSFAEKVVVSLLRLLLPPQSDNEEAAEFLRREIGKNDPNLEWVAVRPDSLIDEDEVSEYELFPEPLRSPIFNPGKTSRINVGHFMAKIVTDAEVREKWKGQMPVIYNREIAEI